VQLEHRNLERYGDAAESMRAALDRGWELTMPLFGKLAEG
jgi:hypothetical protein